MHGIRTILVLLTLTTLVLPAASAARTIDLCSKLPDNGAHNDSPTGEPSVDEAWQWVRYPNWSCEIHGLDDALGGIRRP